MIGMFCYGNTEASFLSNSRPCFQEAHIPTVRPENMFQCRVKKKSTSGKVTELPQLKLDPAIETLYQTLPRINVSLYLFYSKAPLLHPIRIILCNFSSSFIRTFRIAIFYEKLPNLPFYLVSLPSNFES